MLSTGHAQLQASTFEAGPADHPVAAIQDSETVAQRDARMRWWRDARFGMFIHWGLYAVPAGTWRGKPIDGIDEWIMNYASISVADYKALSPQFNPTAFNAHDIVALAKAAGMKYIIITAKHHDGFAMFQSAADPFNIVDATPFHRDPFCELAEALQGARHQAWLLLLAGPGMNRPGGATVPSGKHTQSTVSHYPGRSQAHAPSLHSVRRSP